MQGSLEVIVGPMYSGKSTFLIQRVQRLRVAGANIGCFKPKLDYTRYKTEAIRSHAEYEIPSIMFDTVLELVKRVEGAQFINGFAIDEIHFVSADVVPVIQEFRNRGLHVIVAGLQYDFKEEPFVLGMGKAPATMENIIAMADKKHELTAVCTYQEGGITCGKDATRTQRLFRDRKPVPYNDKLVVVGGERIENAENGDRIYEARCSDHHFVLEGKEILTFDQRRKRDTSS